jgi:hypothetical protein
MGLEHLDTVMSFALIMLLLSLQVTILVQAVIAVSGLRGWNLSWSLSQLFEQLDPELTLKAHATKLSREILKHPALTHVWSLFGRRKATALRLDELFRVLEDLAAGKPPGKPHLKRSKQGTAGRKPDEAELTSALRAALGKTVVGDTPELGKRADEIVAALTAIFPGSAQAVQEAVARVFQRKSKVEVEIQTWFDTVMDRSTERFILCTRWITAAIAFIVALGLHIDSIQIFKQLSTRSDVRARMVQQADTTLEKAGSLVTAAKEPKTLASDAIRAMKEDLKDSKDLEILGTVPGNLATRRAGEEWLQGHLTGPRLTKGLEAYKRRFDEATMAQLGDLKMSFNEVKLSLDQTGLQIIPQPLLSWKDYPGDRGLHLLGLLMTGLFLSLGAPFWYNALSQLANLRPVLAGKVEREAGGEQKETTAL